MNEGKAILCDPRYMVRKATLADKEAVVNMNVTVYGQSFDYLPALYEYFLHSWNNEAVVCEFEGKIVGFLFYTLIDGGETIVSRANRVDADHQGKGVYDLMLLHYLEHLFKVKQNFRIKAQASLALVDKGHSYLAQKYNKHLFCEMLCLYSTSSRASEILSCFQNGRLTNPDFSTLIQLNKTQVRSLLLSPDIYQKLFHGDTVIIDWQPYKCRAENIKDIMDSQNPTVFTDLQCNSESCNSVSFGCTQYILIGNNMRYDINVYTEDKNLAKAHLFAQIFSAAVKNKSYDIRFCIAVKAPITREDLADILQKFGALEDKWHNYSDAQIIGIMIPITELVGKFNRLLNLKRSFD